MGDVLVKPAASLPPLRSEPSLEVQHLQRIIETQPCCLMRAGMDGVLLAANHAAMAMLGADDLVQVLGSSLIVRIAPEHRERWSELTARILEGASASFECELSDLSDAHRAVLLHGIPLLAHEDGIPSVLLTARDASAIRSLESALEERGGIEQHNELQTQLDQAIEEQQRLQGLLEKRDADRERLAAEHNAERARLRQTLAEEHQLALLLNDRDARQRLEQVETELEQARAECLRLETLLEEQAVERQRVIAEHIAERTTLQQALVEEHQTAMLLKEREAGERLDHLQTELNGATDERQRLVTLIQEHEAEWEQVAAAWQEERTEAERTRAAAAKKRERMAKALADQRVDLNTMTENTLTLERLAGTGRLALQIGGDLQTVLGAIESRAKLLLARCPLDAAERQDVEGLRGDTIRAALLARQVAPVDAAGTPTPDPPEATTGHTNVSTTQGVTRYESVP